jgi:Holliday junction resolvase RusA-like endonuclease
MIDFTVIGKPEPAGSKKGFVIKGHVVIADANKKAKPWKLEVEVAAIQAMGERPAYDEPLVAAFLFGMPRPKTVKRELPSVRPDTTKLIRAVEDACTGIVWKDDALIVMQHASKMYTDGPGFVRVIVTPHAAIRQEVPA